MAENSRLSDRLIGEAIEPIDSDAFVSKVGDRVRKARERKAISRRALSEKSKVSQRYLAQLEGGGRNISIALLKRVADALDHRIEWLVGEDDPWSSDAVMVANLYRAASESQRDEVLRALSPSNSEELRGKRVCLVGLRGAGKSTLGKLLAERMNLEFVELNRDIEDQSGMPLSEIMAFYGQEGYRKLERQALERVVAKPEAVIVAVAGGVVSEPETFNFLLRNFHVVWLKAEPEEHMNRVLSQGDHRPMTGNPKAMEELNSILTSRETLYARAEFILNTTDRSPDQSVVELEAMVSPILAD